MNSRNSTNDGIVELTTDVSGSGTVHQPEPSEPPSNPPPGKT